MPFRGPFHPESPPMTVWGSTTNVIFSSLLSIAALIGGIVSGEPVAYAVSVVGTVMTLFVFVPIMVVARRRRARDE